MHSGSFVSGRRQGVPSLTAYRTRMAPDGNLKNLRQMDKMREVAYNHGDWLVRRSFPEAALG